MVDGQIFNFQTPIRRRTALFVELLRRWWTILRNYGLSALNARIRVFEYLLRISYRLNVQKWAVKKPEDKVKFHEKKKEILEIFWKKMSLLVDYVKQGGGNSNNGNTARRLFSNPTLSASITGLQLEVIQKFSMILQIISIGHPIEVNKFRDLCIETAILISKNCRWY